MNVSGIIVKTVPKFLDEVLASLKAYEPCDYHMHDELGRIIVTVEGKDAAEEMKRLKEIQEIPHVVAADMHYTYSEDELDADRDKLDMQGTSMPTWLNDSDAQINEMHYNGDLRKKF